MPRSTIAFSRHMYMGAVLRAHSVHGESHIQRNEVGTLSASVSSQLYI